MSCLNDERYVMKPFSELKPGDQVIWSMCEVPLEIVTHPPNLPARNLEECIASVDRKIASLFEEVDKRNKEAKEKIEKAQAVERSLDASDRYIDDLAQQALLQHIDALSKERQR